MSTTETKTFENGDVFKGEFVNEQPFRGTYTFKNGDVFEGILKNIKNEIQPSMGTITYIKNDPIQSFKGEFHDKKPYRGLLTYKNENTFDGTYDKDGNPLKGSLLFKNEGLEFIGEFNEDGKLLHGKLVYPNLDIFEGYISISGSPIEGTLFSDYDETTESYKVTTEYKNGAPSQNSEPILGGGKRRRKGGRRSKKRKARKNKKSRRN